MEEYYVDKRERGRATSNANATPERMGTKNSLPEICRFCDTLLEFALHHRLATPVAGDEEC